MVICCVETTVHYRLSWSKLDHFNQQLNNSVGVLTTGWGQNDHVLSCVCPSAVDRRSWRITGGAARHCLRACTWATWSCARLSSRSERSCPRNSPTSSATPKLGTTATSPGAALFNMERCVQDWKGIISHVCSFREEWQWLQARSCPQNSGETGQDAHAPTHRLQEELRTAIKDLMAHINMSGSQVRVDLCLCSS